jgi:hypothetical protein
MREGVTHMGRGRQKAKQTKVARKLKYYTPETDYRALERELSGTSNTDDEYSDFEDPYGSEEAGWDQDDDDDLDSQDAPDVGAR